MDSGRNTVGNQLFPQWAEIMHLEPTGSLGRTISNEVLEAEPGRDLELLPAIYT